MGGNLNLGHVLFIVASAPKSGANAKKRRNELRGSVQRRRFSCARSDCLGYRQDGIGCQSLIPQFLPATGLAGQRGGIEAHRFALQQGNAPGGRPECLTSCTGRRAEPFFKWPADTYDLATVDFCVSNEIPDYTGKRTPAPEKGSERREKAASLAFSQMDQSRATWSLTTS